MIYIKDHHEPIISRELWEATQRELQRRNMIKEQKSKHSNRYWCSGKIFCGKCGSRFVGRVKKLKNGDTYRAWRCEEFVRHGTKKTDKLGNVIGCNVGSINHVVLGEIIGYILKNVIIDNKEQIINDLKELIKKYETPVKVKSVDGLLKQIENINRKKEKLIDSMLEGVISKQDVALMNERYDKEIEELKKKIKNIEEININNQKRADTLKSYIDRINALVDDLQNPEEVYRRVVEKIVVHEDKILEIYFNCLVKPIKVRYKATGKLNYRIQVEVLNDEQYC
jgi:hypothetical protein